MKRFSKKSKVLKVKVNKHIKSLKRSEKILFVELLKNPQKNILPSDKEDVIKEIDRHVSRCWGDFGEDFIESHVLSSKYLAIMRNREDKVMGLASISERVLGGRQVYYFELTAIAPEFESQNLAFRLNAIIGRWLIMETLKRGRLKLEFMLITPNMKILGMLAGLSEFIYPNPYLFDTITKKIPQADTETWLMAKDLIAQSEHPERPLHRDGCVLEDSYKDSPNLVYKPGKVPMHRDEVVNLFGEEYLGYSQRSGKELVVRVRIDILNLILKMMAKK